MTDNDIRTVSCPTCQRDTQYNQGNPNRPFCSERCKLIDLGEWADETHRIQGELTSVEFNDPNKTH